MERCAKVGAENNAFAVNPGETEATSIKTTHDKLADDETKGSPLSKDEVVEKGSTLPMDPNDNDVVNKRPVVNTQAHVRQRFVSDLVTKLHEKRKASATEEDDAAAEDIVKAKRKYQRENASESGIGSGEREEDYLGNVKMESLSQDESYLPASMVQSIVDGVSPEEIEDLRKKLDEGYFQNYFSWTFWQSLHSNHGSTLGYSFGFLLILFLNYEWMLEEFADSTEGHSVAKTFVILFVIFSYSFITLGLEFVQLAFLILELYYPQHCKKIQDSFNNLFNSHEKLKKLRTSKYIYTPVVVLWCILTALMSSILWKWFWWNHICKSYHDRTCRGSWLGQLVIKYRDEACYDGTASSMICERFVSYLPIMLFCMLFVFLGNVFMPLLNDRLSAYYPLSENLDAAFSIIDRLSDESVTSMGFSKSNKGSCDCKNGETCNVCHRQNEDLFFLQQQSEVNEGVLRKVQKIIPSALAVVVLLIVDWIIVKKFFP